MSIFAGGMHYEISTGPDINPQHYRPPLSSTEPCVDCRPYIPPDYTEKDVLDAAKQRNAYARIARMIIRHPPSLEHDSCSVLVMKMGLETGISSFVQPPSFPIAAAAATITTTTTTTVTRKKRRRMRRRRRRRKKKEEERKHRTHGGRH